MPSYRESHPEYREKEKEKDNIRFYIKYLTDVEYREKKKKQSLENYYKRKQRLAETSLINHLQSI